MRKEKTITIQDREQELTFVIREMPVTKLEEWIARALLILLKADTGTPTPEGLTPETAAAYIAANQGNIVSSLSVDEMKPLAEELLGCCSRKIGSVLEPCTSETVNDYIEDLKTLLQLRKEALLVNFDFLEKVFEKLSPSLGKVLFNEPQGEPGTPITQM